MAESQVLRQWLIARTISSAGEGVSIKQLIELTGLGDKTIRRDLAELQAAGFPLVEAVGEFGRKTFIMDACSCPPLNLTFDEALALHLCQQALSPLAGTYFWESACRGFAKIEASLGKKAQSYVERMRTHFRRTGLAGNYGEKAELLDQIVMGMEECRAVFIEYHSQSATEPVTRDIFPLGIVEHRGAVYIVAFSPDHDEIRTWKLDRILSAEKTRVPFQRPADFDLKTYLAGSLNMYHGHGELQVRARFAPAVARYITEKRLHASQSVTRERDGGAIATWQLSSTVEIKAALLSFGANVEVLEPASLRAEIRNEVARLKAVYATDSGKPPKRGGKNNAFRHQRK